jgi:hypothetical protein
MADAVRSELKGNGGNIRVCIRVRPPNQRELALPGGVIVNVPPRPPGAISVARPDGEAGEPRNFMLDITFPFTIGQLECFQDVGVEIVQTAYQGFNGKRALARIQENKHVRSYVFKSTRWLSPSHTISRASIASKLATLS